MFIPYYFDPTYILLLPAIILAVYAQAKVQSTFQRYLRVRASSGMTGAQVARALLDKNKLYDVPVEIVPGHLTDHYDPKTKKLRLSPEVYHGTSLAALGVAAHETGHAAQHAQEYIPLNLRTAIFPAARYGSSLAFPLFFIGLLFGRGGTFLMDLGIILFTFAVLFQVVTLPVEFNASKRALGMLESEGYLLRGQEVAGARKVLSAAALTYLAATAMALLQLFRLLLLRGYRDD
ncbi:MAG TPA: zinc metallopeptidase [Firmicutes bacterium]|jgi:Zn-dependent membrane protease YugP|nr:zinc metallopeptidase [Bacillota bacterium]